MELYYRLKGEPLGGGGGGNIKAISSLRLIGLYSYPVPKVRFS